jgi:hypothetical protein
MAFDFAFNFRLTSGYVTDPTYAVPGLAEVFPHTYTNADGLSVNGGWTGIVQPGENNASGNDPRLAGCRYANNAGTTREFQIDLSSGSAPGAGNYAIDLAMGYAPGGARQDFQILDTATLLIDGTAGGAGIATATGHYLDATLADVAATTSWTGTPAVKTFATTTVNIHIGISAIALYTTMPHFRLTLQEAPAGLAIPVLLAQYRQRRS